MERPFESESPWEGCISPVTGLADDYANVWGQLFAITSFWDVTVEEMDGDEERQKGMIASGDKFFQKLKMLTYEAYFQEKSEEERRYVLGKSNPESVAKINALASEFEADRDRIGKEKDSRALKDFVRRANVIIYGQE